MYIVYKQYYSLIGKILNFYLCKKEHAHSLYYLVICFIVFILSLDQSLYTQAQYIREEILSIVSLLY